MRRLALGLAGSLLAALAFGNTYTVTTTADAGAGSLRQAITDANTNPGADTIAFAIVGTGPHTITLASDLPGITDAVTIDGYTQGGASPNTRPVGEGLDTVLQVVVTANASGACFASSASNVTIRGLVVHRCNTAAIQLTGAGTNNVVAGNFLGTLADGATLPANGNVSAGVSISGQTGARVGGTLPADRNLIAGFNFGQVSVSGGTGHLVQGNLIGLKASGLETLAGQDAANGVHVTAGSAVVGGSAAAARNAFGSNLSGVLVQGTADATIEGNFFGLDVTGERAIIVGVFVSHGAYGIQTLSQGDVQIRGNRIGGVRVGIGVSSGAPVIEGNFIGTDPTGTIDLSTQLGGVSVQNASGAIIGGIGAGEGNLIANSGRTASPAAGVGVLAGKATIRGNSIHSTRTPINFADPPPTDVLGIDLAPGSFGGVTPNDPGDGDSGANGLQNFPLITSAAPDGPQGSGTRVVGTLNSAASTTYDLDFYAICNARPQDLLEGKDYIGSIQVTTNASGDASFDEVLPTTISAGTSVTATATDPDGNTSEFSQQIVTSSSALSGPAAGGTSVTFKGMLFEDGATVTVGGVPATNVVVANATTITATMPARPAGSVNDVVVSNPGGPSGTLTNGWVANFLDVNQAHLFYTWIRRLVRSEVTAGVGAGNYGPEQSTLRQQMAVFLLKGKYGVCYTPPPCTGTFDDVSCPSTFAPWIEALAAEGITGGCGGDNYCPLNPVLRQQMAVFLLKAEHGSDYVPPPCSGDFLDVPCPSTFAPWIEQLAAEGITGGCGGGNFCPGQAVTRGQMAAFLGITFRLPW
jgi:IPT/TIG domain/S-layer homology domain